MTITEQKEQAERCVAWLATVNMHRAEENRFDRDPNGSRWNEDEEWEDAVEEAKEEALEEGAYLDNPTEEVISHIKSLKANELWNLFEMVDTTPNNLSFVIKGA